MDNHISLTFKFTLCTSQTTKSTLFAICSSASQNTTFTSFKKNAYLVNLALPLCSYTSHISNLPYFIISYLMCISQYQIFLHIVVCSCTSHITKCTLAYFKLCFAPVNLTLPNLPYLVINSCTSYITKLRIALVMDTSHCQIYLTLNLFVRVHLTCITTLKSL